MEIVRADVHGCFESIQTLREVSITSSFSHVKRTNCKAVSDCGVWGRWHLDMRTMEVRSFGNQKEWNMYRHWYFVAGGPGEMSCRLYLSGWERVAFVPDRGVIKWYAIVTRIYYLATHAPALKFWTNVSWYLLGLRGCHCGRIGSWCIARRFQPSTQCLARG
jgi:hypothetical protein